MSPLQKDAQKRPSAETLLQRLEPLGFKELSQDDPTIPSFSKIGLHHTNPSRRPPV